MPTPIDEASLSQVMVRFGRQTQLWSSMLSNVQNLTTLLTLAGGRWWETRSDLDDDLLADAGTPAVVYADADEANNGLYVKVGASTVGSWSGPFLLLGSTVTLGALTPEVFDLFAPRIECEPILVGGRLLQPTALSFDLLVLAGLWLDDGSLYSPLTDGLQADVDALTADVEAHGRQLSNFCFGVPVITLDGRPLRPTLLSFDLYVLQGVYEDTGESYDALAPDISPAIELAANHVFAPPVELAGRLIQPTVLSFDLRVVSGVYLDTGEPFSPLAADLAQAVAITQNYIDAPPVLVGDRWLQPLALSFDLYVQLGVWQDTGALYALGLPKEGGAKNAYLTEATIIPGDHLTGGGGWSGGALALAPFDPPSPNGLYEGLVLSAPPGDIFAGWVWGTLPDDAKFRLLSAGLIGVLVKWPTGMAVGANLTMILGNTANSTANSRSMTWFYPRDITPGWNLLLVDPCGDGSTEPGGDPWTVTGTYPVTDEVAYLRLQFGDGAGTDGVGGKSLQLGGIFRYGGRVAKGAVIFGFDGDRNSIHDVARPLHEARSIPWYQALDCEDIVGGTADRLVAHYARGADIISQGLYHTNYRAMPGKLAEHYDAAKAILDGLGMTRASAFFAYPFGDYSPETDAILRAKGCMMARTTYEHGLCPSRWSPAPDLPNHGCFDLGGNTLAWAKNQIDLADRHGKTVVFLIHDLIAGGTGGAPPADPLQWYEADYTALLDYAVLRRNAGRIDIQGLAEWAAAREVAAPVGDLPARWPAVLDDNFEAGFGAWTSIGANVAASYNGDVRMTRTAVGDTGILIALTGLTIGQTCRLEFDFAVSGTGGNAGGRLTLGVDAGGGVGGAVFDFMVKDAAHPSPLYFTATATTHYLALRQTAGTAGQIIDWRAVLVTVQP